MNRKWTGRDWPSRLIMVLCFVLSTALSGCGKDDDTASNLAKPAPAPTPGAPSQQSGPCQTVALPSGRTLDYCIQRSTKSELPENVVYFFHGLGGSASDLFKEPLATILRVGLEQLGTQMPHFVSVSYGAQGLIPADTTGGNTTKAGELIRIAMPKIERDLGYTIAPPKRQVMGGSMGGFNSLTVAASQPDKFKAVISLCPAVINFDPYNPTEVEAYINRHSPYANRDLLNQALMLLHATFPAPADWQASDPIRLLAAGRYDSLSLFMSVGRQDQYGYIEGAQTFADQAQARGIKITWRPVDGPHCIFDSAAMIEFLKANL